MNRFLKAHWLLPLIAIIALGKAGWIEGKAVVAQHLLEHAWQQSSDNGEIQKPWPWFDSYPVAELIWPDGERQILLHGLSGQALAFAPGLQILDGQGRSLEVNQWTNANTLVVGGHNDTHLATLKTINTGDEFVLLDTNRVERSYRVAQQEVADSRTTRILPVVAGHQRLLLVTCYPFDALLSGGPMRYVVTAYPING